MQVAVKNQKDTYNLDMPCEEHVGKSSLKADKQVTCHKENGSLISTNQSRPIESLLPDEEDLLSGVLDELGCTATDNSDNEDFDVFSSSGGVELEGNSKLYFHQWNSVTGEGLNCDQSSPEYLISSKHPSRTLLVKNVDNRVEDSELRVRFERHGDAQTFNTTCKCQNSNDISFPQVVSSCKNDDYIYGIHSPNEMSSNAFPVDAPFHANCSYTNIFPSPVEISSIYNQFGGHTSQYSTYQAFHPQTLPRVISYDSLNVATVGFTTETKDKHLHMLGPYGPSMEHLFEGSSRIGRSGLTGVHQSFRCSNSFQNHLNPVIWSHSLPFNNGPCVQTTSNCMESTPNSMKYSYRKPRGRLRRISHGRHETVSCHKDERKFELDIERVLHGEDCRTTLMIKNIPNKYSSAMLLAAIDEHNQGTYDFIYLPLDFKNKCNMGYAFINMTDPLQIVPFHKSFNGKKWEKFHSGKVACLAYARIQGKAALISHFQESSLMNEDKSCHPILFTTEGPNAGNQEPFPLGPNIHSRRHKNRCNTHEVNENQEIMSISLEGKSSYHV